MLILLLMLIFSLCIYIYLFKKYIYIYQKYNDILKKNIKKYIKKLKKYKNIRKYIKKLKKYKNITQKCINTLKEYIKKCINTLKEYIKKCINTLKEYIEKCINFFKKSKHHTKILCECEQAPTLTLTIGCVITGLTINLDYLDVFVNIFNTDIAKHSVEVISVGDKLTFELPDTTPLEEKLRIIKKLESTDSLILEKLKRIDSLVAKGINLRGDLLDDPESSLSLSVNRLKTLQLKYKYC